MRAVIRINDSANYLLECWRTGLTNAGYTIVPGIDNPQSDDVLVLWNRSIRDEEMAQRFEAAGALVLVAENGYLGKKWNGKKWFALSVGHHNGGGTFPVALGESRMRKHGFVIAPWRVGGSEIIALPQRGIGEPGVAMPKWWACPTWTTRIRPHKGIRETIELEDDLRDAKAVVTWGSGAAIRALAMGIPVFYDYHKWIGHQGGTHISKANPIDPQHGDRQAAFEAVFAAMWTDEEVATGEPFEELRKCV